MNRAPPPSALAPVRIGADRFLAHVRALWPRGALLPPLPFVLAALVAALAHRLRWDHVAIVLVVAFLSYANRGTKRLCIGLYPLGLVALLYDAMFYFRDLGVTADRIHVCDLRRAEMAWFGISSDGRRETLQDWLQAHASWPLDLLCAVPYATFIYASIACAAFLFRRDFAAMLRFGWAFLLLNVMGFVTYHAYPAAPPWYFHAYGCAVDVHATAREGPNLARVDAWLGVAYFHAFYARASSVFGAVPSLHVAYPLLIAVEGWTAFSKLFRTLAFAFWVLMCFAAIYLDHHWVIDVLMGVVYGAIALMLVRAVSHALASMRGRRAMQGRAT